LCPGVASAKVPSFSIEVPPDPIAGETMRLTVRFWNDARHTDRATWWDIPALSDFLCGRPVGDASQAIPIDIRIVRPGVYRGPGVASLRRSMGSLLVVSSVLGRPKIGRARLRASR
jgi:hypothetical protein